MIDALTLYDRRIDGDPDDLRCEWCGRPGQAVPLHVRSADGDIEFAEPVLCAVCQGLVGYLHPHGSERLQPAEAQADPHAWAADIVSRLLADRFVAEGRPRPAWAEGPTWKWPPGPDR